MRRRQFTPEQRTARIEGRATQRVAVEEKVGKLRAWRDDRARHARERAAAKRLDAEDQERGIHRVPAALRDLSPTTEVETPELGTFRGIEAPYATRRAMGQRGRPRRPRPPRRRDLPGAMERRIERNRKEWSQ